MGESSYLSLVLCVYCLEAAVVNLPLAPLFNRVRFGRLCSCRWGGGEPQLLQAHCPGHSVSTERWLKSSFFKGLASLNPSFKLTLTTQSIKYFRFQAYTYQLTDPLKEPFKRTVIQNVGMQRMWLDYTSQATVYIFWPWNYLCSSSKTPHVDQMLFYQMKTYWFFVFIKTAVHIVDRGKL